MFEYLVVIVILLVVNIVMHRYRKSLGYVDKQFYQLKSGGEVVNRTVQDANETFVPEPKRTKVVEKASDNTERNCYCIMCGTKFIEEAEFCSNCGAKR